MEGYQTTCGYVGVERERDPESAAGGEVIGLAVARFRPANPELPPLVYLPGGPGGDALSIFGGPELLAVLSSGKREVIFFDPRGVGLSLPDLRCPTRVDDFGDPSKVDGWIRDCHRDARGYDSVENAADVAAISAALGHERIAIFASSYGTRLAQHVLRDHPSLVSSVILEGVVPMEGDADLLGSWGAAIEEAVTSASTTCQAIEDCRAIMPNLEAEVAEILDGLPPEGILIGGERLTPLEFAKQLRFAASQFGLEELIRVVLAARRLMQVPPDSSTILDDDAETLLWNRIQSSGYEGHPVWTAVSASERAPRREATSTQWPAMRGGADELIRGVDQAREAWQIESLPGSATQPVQSGVPALLINGGVDASSPASWARLVGRSLSNSTVVIVPTAGHGVAIAGDPCGIETARAFLADPTATVDTSCTSELRFEALLLTGWDS